MHYQIHTIFMQLHFEYFMAYLWMGNFSESLLPDVEKRLPP